MYNTYNKLTDYTFLSTGYLKEKKEKVYTFEGDSLKIDNELCVAASLEQMKKQFPYIFSQSEPCSYAYKKDAYGYNREKYMYSILNLSCVPDKADFIKLTHPDGKSGTKANEGIVNDDMHTYTAIFGIKEKGVKLNEYKDFDFVTYGDNQEVLSKFNIKFQYPQILLAELEMLSAENDKQAVGKAFIFEKKPFVGKKESDPEDNNIQVVICSVDGQLILQSTSKFDIKEKGKLNIHGVFQHKDEYFVHFNAFEKGDQFAGIAQFSKTGESKVATYSKSILKEKTVVVKSEKDADNMESRKVLPTAVQNPGHNWDFTSTFNMHGIKKVSSGLYIWGKITYEIDDPTFVPTNNPNAPQMGSMFKPKIKLFGEQVVYKYDEQMNLIASYILNLPVSKTNEKLQYVAPVDEGIVFLMPSCIRPVSEHFQYERRMFHFGQMYSDYNYPDLYNPMLIKLTNQRSYAQILKDFILIHPEKAFISAPDKNKLYMISFKEKENDVKIFDLRSVDYVSY